MPKLETIVKQWLQVRHEVALLQDRLNELRKPIEKALERSKTRKKAIAGVILSLVTVKGKRFDQDKARAELGDETVEKFMVETETQRLTVK